MAQSKKVNDVMKGMKIISADDPNMIEKLNLIAQKVAEAQGKTTASTSTSLNNVESDPMDELGCEGCQ